MLRSSELMRTTALYPVLRGLQSMLGWTPDDGTEVLLDRLDAELGALPVTAGTALVSGLLGAHHVDSTLPGVDPSRRRALLLKVMESWIERRAHDHPCCLVIEDLHWADPTTLEFLAPLVDRDDELPLLVVASRRPGLPVVWEHHSRVRTVQLDPLTHDEAVELVDRIAGEPLPADVVEQIISRSDRIPLYISELAAVTSTGIVSGATCPRCPRHPDDAARQPRRQPIPCVDGGDDRPYVRHRAAHRGCRGLGRGVRSRRRHGRARSARRRGRTRRVPAVHVRPRSRARCGIRTDHSANTRDWHGRIANAADPSRQCRRAGDVGAPPHRGRARARVDRDVGDGCRARLRHCELRREHRPLRAGDEPHRPARRGRPAGGRVPAPARGGTRLRQRFGYMSAEAERRDQRADVLARGIGGPEGFPVVLGLWGYYQVRSDPNGGASWPSGAMHSPASATRGAPPVGGHLRTQHHPGVRRRVAAGARTGGRGHRPLRPPPRTRTSRSTCHNTPSPGSSASADRWPGRVATSSWLPSGTNGCSTTPTVPSVYSARSRRGTRTSSPVGRARCAATTRRRPRTRRPRWPSPTSTAFSSGSAPPSRTSASQPRCSATSRPVCN